MKALTIDPYVRIWNRLADGGEICSGGFDPKNDPDDRRKFWLIIIGIVAFILMFVSFSSCTRKVYVPVEKHTTVTETMVDTLVEIRLEEIHDTVRIQTEGRDTVSYLANKYAYSFASVVDGVLGHSIGTIPGAIIKDTVKVKYIHITDSIPYPVEVEKKLTFWQSVKIEYGGFAMGLSAAFAFVTGLLIYTTRRRE